MSITTKSRRKVAAAAYRIAKSSLPEYAHRYSPKKFTQPQLFVCLVLKTFFKTDYRSIAAILNDCRDLCKAFGLATAPHFTPLQKASKRMLASNTGEKLLVPFDTFLLAREVIFHA